MHLSAARRRNLMFPTCLGCLRKLSGRPTASTTRCACELTSRLRLVAVLLRPDRSDAVDPVVAHTHAAIAYPEKGALCICCNRRLSNILSTRKWAVRGSDIEHNPAPRSDDRVLGWTPRRPRVLEHCASIRGGDCFRPERCTQPRAWPPRLGWFYGWQRHPWRARPFCGGGHPPRASGCS